MFDLDRWEEIVTTITRNKWRSFMTAMGVFWGVFLLVIMLGVSFGFENTLFGNVTIPKKSAIFFGNSTSIAYEGLPKGRYVQFKYDDFEIIKDKVKEIDFMIAMARSFSDLDALYGSKSSKVETLSGLDTYSQILSPIVLLHGRMLSELDMNEARKVCTIGENVYNSLFPAGENAIGEDIIISGKIYTIVGVHKKISNNMSFGGGNASSAVYIPLSLLDKIYNLNGNVQGFLFSVKDHVDIEKVMAKVDEVLRQLYTISPLDKRALYSQNFELTFSAFSNLFLGIYILTWIVGLGTLLAGVVGVSNIMLILVKERTQEIGVRRALGATPRNIFVQIMTESFVLTFIAGVAALGLAVGVLSIVGGITESMTMDLPFSPMVSFEMAVASAGAIIVSGFLAGLIPTFRAINIRAVDAIREE